MQGKSALVNTNRVSNSLKSKTQQAEYLINQLYLQNNTK